LLLLALFLTSPLAAQAPARSNGAAEAAAETVDDGIPRNADGLKILSLASYGEWKRITGASISQDGVWMTYTYAPRDGDAKMYVRELDGSREHEVAEGTSASFSDDGAWIAYLIPSAREGGSRARARQESSAPQRGGNAGGGRNEPRTLQVRNLRDGSTADIPGVASFEFTPDSRYLIARRPKADSDAEHDGVDVVLRDLRTGTTQVLGNVGAYELNEAGTLLAYIIDAKDRVGNGVFIHELATGTMRPIRTAALDYDGLTWNDDG